MLYPVPAVMVSCQRPGEKPNIITIAWAGTVCSSPAMVSISVRKERYSYDILKETGEFVINLVTKDLVRAADFCGVRSGRDVDKFQEMHLTEQPSQTIQSPGIGESPVNIECKVTEVKPLGSHDLFLWICKWAKGRVFAVGSLIVLPPVPPAGAGADFPPVLPAFSSGVIGQICSQPDQSSRTAR